MVYLSRYDFELNDTFQLNPDICSMSSAAQIPSYNHHQKDLDMEYLAINNRISSYTEFLTTDMEAYGIITHTTSCSSPNSDDNYMFGVDDPKIKMEYDNLDVYNMSRTLSAESCPELAGCNQATTPLTPVDSPRDRSPIMTPMSHQYHQPQQQPQQQLMVNEDQVIMESTQATTNRRGRGRKPATATNAVMTNTTMSAMQIQDPQEFQSLMGSSSSLPSPPQKSSGKSRGRRMTNKPAKPGTKSFECNYAGCGRVFKRSEHLKRHIRSIHTLERPFHCPHPHCSKRFSRSDNLSQHVRVHRPNGKEKNSNARAFNNFTPFLQTYQTGNLHTTLQQH